MKVVNIDFENKSFTTDDGAEYPFVFNIDKSITMEEFQRLIDESGSLLYKILNH